MSKKILTGKVISNKMKNTVKVQVSSTKSHKMYGRLLKTSKSYMAHTVSDLNEGSIVEITESRPYSKNVKFLVTKIIEG